MSDAAQIRRRQWLKRPDGRWAAIAWAAPMLAAALVVTSRAAETDFRSLLDVAGVTLEDLAQFRGWQGELNMAEASVLAQVLYRLDQAESRGLDRQPAIESAGELLAASQPPRDSDFGRLIRIEATLVAIKPIELPADAPEELRTTGLQWCELDASGRRLCIISRRVPRSLAERGAGEPLRAPVTFTGVLLGTCQLDSGPGLLAAANRLEWYPVSDVPKGLSLMVSRGFDASLLDDVRQSSGFAKAAESLEGRAFYAALAALAGVEPAALVEVARQSVAEAAQRAQAARVESADAVTRLSRRLEALPPESDERAQLQQRLADQRRSAALARATIERAELGLSSVWPMFVEPQQSVGQAFLIQGTARRAVRIVVDDPRAAQATAGPAPAGAPLREYYELDVFTTDAPRDHPIVCCVARLPEGFPTGDVIREPVQVAGVFFKKWAYARRSDRDAAAGSDLPARLAPPLLLGVQPQWLARQEAGSLSQGVGAAIALTAAAIIIGGMLALISHRDRLARRRIARYDATLSDPADS